MTVATEIGRTGSATHRAAGWVCLTIALIHVTAVILGIYLVRSGNLVDFSPLKLLRYIPAHLAMWRATCLAAAAASLSFLVFTVLARELLGARVRGAMTLAVVLVAVGLANDLNGELSMMVLFSDLAHQLKGHGTFLEQETMQLAWATMNQSLTQTVLIANTLYSLCGCIITACALASGRWPKWLAWLAAPIWITGLNTTALAFFGMLHWALVLALAGAIAFAMWLTVVGLVLRSTSDHAPEHEEGAAHNR